MARWRHDQTIGGALGSSAMNLVQVLRSLSHRWQRGICSLAQRPREDTYSTPVSYRLSPHESWWHQPRKLFAFPLTMLLQSHGGLILHQGVLAVRGTSNGKGFGECSYASESMHMPGRCRTRVGIECLLLTERSVATACTQSAALDA